MSGDETTGGEPATWAEFESAVRALVGAADRNGVRVDGSVDVAGADGNRWTVEVTRVASSEADGSETES